MKFKGLAREGKDQHFQALVSGFEYTFYGLMDSPTDLGLIAEYHYNTQRDPGLALFNNDLFLGTRLTLNDPQDTTFLAGVFYDHRNETASARLEFERRLGDRYTLEIQGQWFARSDRNDLAYAFRRDSHVQIALRRYF